MAAVVTQRCRCQYCGREIPKNIALHERNCPRNPDVFERLRAFMREWAENGAGPSVGMFNELARGEGLPFGARIIDTFGTWGDFVRACGLEHRPYTRGRGFAAREFDPEHMPGSVMADDFRWHDPSVLRCEPARIPVRAWHPHEKRYVEIGVQGVWRVR